jgi:uncharacterized membrane protein
MPSAVPGPVDEPARTDPVIRGLSETIGGPLGDHAVRPSRTGGRFWTVTRIVLALTCLMLVAHWLQKSPCRDGAWVNESQYKYFCYTDVLALYYNEGLSEGEVPYADHQVEYPVLTGALLGVIGLPVHALGERFPALVERPGQTFYDLNALVLSALGVATVAALLALRRRRPWDAAMFALAPALLASATVNWDLLVVAFAAFAMLAWAKRRPVLAGVLIGLGISSKLYPVLLFGPIVLLAMRTRRWRGALISIGTAVMAWLAVNLPVAVLWPDSWLKFWRFNSERGVDWGTLWYIGSHFPRGGGEYGFSWFTALERDPEHSALNTLYFGFFLAACVAIALLALSARRRPRFAQLAFLIVAAFLLSGKVWSQQYVLWLLPLAVLARPRWGGFLAWQAAELLYFVAFYGELLGASSGRPVFPEGVFVLASIARWVTLALLAGLVVADILHPERDAVRQTYLDDPDGGEFDGAPDQPLLRRWHGPAGDETSFDVQPRAHSRV